MFWFDKICNEFFSDDTLLKNPSLVLCLILVVILLVFTIVQTYKSLRYFRKFPKKLQNVTIYPVTIFTSRVESRLSTVICVRQNLCPNVFSW